MWKKTAAALMLAAALMFAAPAAQAHEYDRDDDDLWLRYVAYPFHAVGIVLEYSIFRPVHKFVSQPNNDILFGHDVTEDGVYDYYEWK